MADIIKKIRTASGDLPIEPIAASTTQLGGVIPDGTTIIADENGVISSTGESGANTDLSNLSDTGKGVIDGQWVNKSLSLVLESTSITENVLDLSEFLPNDNYNYEVIAELSVYFPASISAGSYRNLSIKTSIIPNTGMCVCRKQTSNVIDNNITVVIIPIGVDRRMTVGARANDSESAKWSIMLKAYRRLGTNS